MRRLTNEELREGWKITDPSDLKSHDPVEILNDLYRALETAVGLLWEHCEGLGPRIELLEQVLEKARGEK